jgi:hypothetical protein
MVEIAAKAQGHGSAYPLTSAGLAVWAIRRNADPRWLPDERFVVRFELRGTPSGVRLRPWWLGGERGSQHGDGQRDHAKQDEAHGEQCDVAGVEPWPRQHQSRSLHDPG